MDGSYPGQRYRVRQPMITLGLLGVTVFVLFAMVIKAVIKLSFFLVVNLCIVFMVLIMIGGWHGW